MKYFISFYFCLFYLLCIPFFAAAQQSKEPPPAIVVTSRAKTGEVVPTLSYVGTVEFPEVANVASKIAGGVEDIRFEEGERVEKGQILAVVDTALLARSLETARWSAQESKVALELAEKELQRMQSLIQSNTITQQDFDQAQASKRQLEYKYSGLNSVVERLSSEVARGTIRAPFNGVVLEKKVARGEWLSPGTPVAVVARDSDFDIVVNVPENIWRLAEVGLALEVEVAGGTFAGKLHAVIASGDASTRTFPVKVRISGEKGLAQGMQAKVRLASGLKASAIIVHRDAIVKIQGKDMVFVVTDGVANPAPVEILRYDGLDCAVISSFLKQGMEVVTKGNERLRPGQKVKATLQN